MLTHRVRPALAAILTVVVGWSALADHEVGSPLIPDPGFELSAHARLFGDVGPLEAMLEYAGTYETDREAIVHRLTAGGYYRVHRNLKAGAFYRLQFGARHDEDWIKVSMDDWRWRDTSQRLEHVAILDLTPRLLLDFLPGSNWVLAVKNRYELTAFRQDDPVLLHSLLVRPGLTYFLLRDREPLLNLSLQYATYWSLSFGDVPWYRHGPYLNVLYHLAPGLSVDASLGMQWVYWTESSDYLMDWPTLAYFYGRVYRPWTVDVGVIYKMQH